MNKESLHSFENPISVLKINETELTGSMALVAYALIYASKSPAGKISYSELENVQRDPRDGYSYQSRFVKLLPRVLGALENEGIEVDRVRVQGKTHGRGPNIEYRISDKSDNAENLPTVSFGIEQGSNFINARGPKAKNSLLQQANRINQFEEYIIGRRRGRPRKEVVIKEQPVDKSRNILLSQIPDNLSDLSPFEKSQLFFSLMSFASKDLPKPFVYKENANQSVEEWGRNWEILGKYLGTGAYLAGLNREYKSSHSRSGQLVGELIKSAYKNAPLELKEVFSLDDLLSKKHHTLEKAFHMSNSKKGRISKAIAAVREGRTMDYVRRELDVKPSQIRKYANQGLVEISDSQETKHEIQRQYIGFLGDGLLDDSQIRELFKDFEEKNNIHAARILLTNGITSSLSDFSRSRNTFIRRNVREVYEFLKENNIPIFKILNKANNGYYIYVLNGHEPTEEIFNSEYFDKYRENPVTVLGREVDVVPTTSITYSHEYMSISNITERALHLKHGMMREAIGKDCPVSVYAVRGSGIYIKRDDLESFSAWLESQKPASLSS